MGHFKNTLSNSTQNIFRSGLLTRSLTVQSWSDLIPFEITHKISSYIERYVYFYQRLKFKICLRCRLLVVRLGRGVYRWRPPHPGDPGVTCWPNLVTRLERQLKGRQLLRSELWPRSVVLTSSHCGLMMPNGSVFHKHRRPEISPATGLSVSGYIFVNLKK